MNYSAFYLRVRPLPTQIGLLNRLSVLSLNPKKKETELSRKIFTGTIPTEIGNLNLIALDLSNAFEGTLPSQIGLSRDSHTLQ